jgi:AraC-like DNA-binding protein
MTPNYSSRQRKVHYEDVPIDTRASFTLREFRWPEFPFNWHYHPELELTLIVKGFGLRFVGDSVGEFKAGDLCLVGENTPHTWASAPTAPPSVCSLVIQFTPDNWGEPFWHLPEMRPFQRLFADAVRGLRFSGTTQRVVSDLLTRITEQSPGSWLRFTTFLQMLGALAEGAADSVPLASGSCHHPPNHEANRTLGQVLSLIHAQASQGLTQKQAARAAGRSPQAFSQFFKRLMGKTYAAYVNELKIRNACQALIETNQNITDVAFSVGFNNLSHFNEQFRRLKGMTPRAYRRQVSLGTVPGDSMPADERLGSFR